LSKKLTYGFVKEQFEKEGYCLLSEIYINAYLKLEYVCINGHKHSISWNSWQQGKRCPYCAGQGKPSIEFIRKEFKKEGYKLLTVKYKNNKQKLFYICSNGHVHSICWNDWIHGYRCPYCAGVAKKNIEFIKDAFLRENYKVLSNIYINNKTKLDYICPDGHKHSISWNDWVNGYRCPTCAVINNTGPNHPNWRGGISCEPYCDVWLDKEFKESIKARDNYKCQNPDCWGTSDKLCIHHIDYNKKNCSPDNLITLCISCNSRANKDREYHTKWYKSLINKSVYK